MNTSDQVSATELLAFLQERVNAMRHPIARAIYAGLITRMPRGALSPAARKEHQ